MDIFQQAKISSKASEEDFIEGAKQMSAEAGMAFRSFLRTKLSITSESMINEYTKIFTKELLE